VLPDTAFQNSEHEEGNGQVGWTATSNSFFEQTTKVVMVMEETNEQVSGAWKKNIVLFLSSQTISLFGSSLVQYAMMWYITLTTQSGVMMTIFILCGFVPAFLLSPAAGVWADRYNRKMLCSSSWRRSARWGQEFKRRRSGLFCRKWCQRIS